MTRPLKPGPTTSEYEQTLRAEKLGRGLVLLAVILCLVGLGVAAGALARGDVMEGAAMCGALGLMAVGFGLSGAHVIAHSTAGYARSRGEVKAAAAAPPVNVSVNKQHTRAI